MTNQTGVIDITNLVGKIKFTWVQWATALVVAAAKTVPWLSWLALPVISPLFSLIIEKIVGAIADGLEMQGFFLNTAILKASQAEDFTRAVEALQMLPPTASAEEYKNAEKKKMAAFSALVRVAG